ncbi:MAG: ABC transporter permease subunit [Planctomycetaceae bacterium]
MRAFWSLFGLPLLAKELTEQAARRRTYVIRTVYAVLLCGFAVLIFWGEVFQNINDPLDMLGQGRSMLQILVALQIAGIVLFVPALSCGAISGEKESNTFGLLLLTRLGPGTILLEKYLGRVFSMVTFLLLSFPLIGFCYALGGVQQQDIWLSIFILLTMVFQLSALGVFCSAFFRTTVASFIATYILGALLFFGPILIQLSPSSARADMRRTAHNVINRTLQRINQSSLRSIEKLDRWTGAKTPTLSQKPQWETFNVNSDDMHIPFFPAPQMMSQMFNEWSPTPTWAIAIRAVPAWMLTGLLLLLARLVLVRRAFLQPRNYLMDFFRLIDRMFHAMNNRFTKGVVLVNDTLSLPVDDPVAWREVSKRSLGTFRYLLRIFLAMEVPILTVGLVVLGIGDFSSNLRHPLFLFFSIIAWTLGLLLVVVKSSTIISGERSSETLNVLLSTPLSSREIIWQKLAGVRRLSFVVAIPILTVVGLQMWYVTMHGVHEHTNYGYRGGRSNVDAIWLVYGLTQFLCVLVLIPLASWLSLLIGLLVRTQTRAIFTSLAVLVAWIVVPFVVAMITMSALGHEYEEVVLPTLLVSPAMLPALMESGELGGFSYEISHSKITPYLVILFTLGFYLGVVIVLRTLTLRWAPYLLGRQESGAELRYKSKRHALPTLAGRPSRST